MATLLEKYNATVTLCHSRTRNLPDVVRTADILVAAMGKSEFIKGRFVPSLCCCCLLAFLSSRF